MNQTIDCLFIGHNEMAFTRYEENIRETGIASGAYRDLNLNFLTLNGKPHTASDIFNRFSKHTRPVNLGEVFSAGIAYLGTYLHRRGFTFDYINAFQYEKEVLKEKLLSGNIRTVAVTTTLYVAVYPILEIMEFIRRYAPSIPVVVGGPYVATQVRTQEPGVLQYIFKSIGADYYIDSSQGEASLVKLLHALATNQPVTTVENLYYKTAKGYEYTRSLREDNDLSENSVDWQLFSRRVGAFTAVRSSISCPFACSFCGFPEHAGPYRTIDIETMEKELCLMSQLGTVKNVHFIDDTFNVPTKRFKQILSMLIRKKETFNFKWYTQIRCQFLDREAAVMMKEAGCEGVFLGIESGNPGILTNMNKKTDIDLYLKGITLLKEQNIPTFGCFIVGFPGETPDTVQDTIRFIETSGLDFYRAQLWYCDPITPIYKQKEKYHLQGAHFKWSHQTMDWETACDLVDHIFCSISRSVWVPIVNFDFVSLFHLTHRGLSIDQVKHFLTAFNNGIKNKLAHLSQPLKEVDTSTINQLRESLISLAPVDAPVEQEELVIDFDLDI